MQWLLSQTQRDLVNGPPICRRSTQLREVDRDPRPPDCGFRAEFIGSDQNSRARLGGLAQLVALERADLLPVEFQHPVRQLRDRYTQDVVRMLGHVLDAVLDQRHQRGELDVAVLKPVSRIATTRCPRNNGSAPGR